MYQTHRATEALSILSRGLLENGWVVRPSCGSCSSVDFCHTIGLAAEKNLPELIIFGLPVPIAYQIIHSTVAEMQEHTAHKDGMVLRNVANYPTILKTVPFQKIAPFFDIGIEFFSEPVPVMQIIFPDKNGLFPWQSGCNDFIAGVQSHIVNWRTMPQMH